MDAATQGEKATARNSLCLKAVILMRRCISATGRTFAVLAVLFRAFGLKAGASATLLIEAPYGKVGFFTATGHSVVYLSGVGYCAEPL